MLRKARHFSMAGYNYDARLAGPMKRNVEKFAPPPLINSACTECGGVVPDAFETCDQFFLAVLVRAGEATTRSTVHPQLYRLVVDTFGMQHPARSCLSPKSYAAHLTGLCCAMEYGISKSVYAALQRWPNGPAERIGLVRPKDLSSRGRITVGYVSEASSDEEFEARVHEWASDVWQAYQPQHKIARSWIRDALGR